MSILLKENMRTYNKIQVSSSNMRPLQIPFSTSIGQEARWLSFRRHTQGDDSQYLDTKETVSTKSECMDNKYL